MTRGGLEKRGGNLSLSLSLPRSAPRFTGWLPRGTASVICVAIRAAVPRSCWLSARAGAAHAHGHFPCLATKAKLWPMAMLSILYMLGSIAQAHQAQAHASYTMAMAMAMPCHA